MRVLLISTYELGHQPLHVASPAAALRDAGHDVACLDTSVQAFDDDLVDWAEVVGLSVPMHTAMRLAMKAAEAIRDRRPDLPVCFYGLYAPVSRDLTVGRLADQVIAGEYEPTLVAWVNGLEGDAATGAGAPSTTSSAPADGPTVQVPAPDSDDIYRLDRGSFSPPARDLLPALERYAHLAADGEERPVGYVEATHGCLKECRHCPVPTVYGGTFRAADRDMVLDDIARLVDMGASHITFGDPDFLNGPTHSLRLITAMHERWPHLTFDCTTKVDHILDNDEVWPTFADAGCLFVVSAFETLNDDILKRLDKGHTAAQAGHVIKLLRDHGIEVRPSWMPFTPWTRIGDLIDILDFVAEHDLIANVDPVHYTIRLLVPEGSLLLDHPDLAPHLGDYDPEALTYTWQAADPAVDTLQAELSDLVEAAVADGASNLETFLDVNAAVREAAGGRNADAERPAVPAAVGATEDRPRLTEPWFCCAEPTAGQFGSLRDDEGA